MGGEITGQRVRNARSTAVLHHCPWAREEPFLQCALPRPPPRSCPVLAVWPRRNRSAWQPQLLTHSNTESGHALIFRFFSDGPHLSFYITGDTISNKIKDERYRTH